MGWGFAAGSFFPAPPSQRGPSASTPAPTHIGASQATWPGRYFCVCTKKVSNYQATPLHTTSHASKVSKTLSVRFPKSLLPGTETLLRLWGFCSRAGGVGLLYSICYFWTIMVFVLLFSPSSPASKEYFCFKENLCL